MDNQNELLTNGETSLVSRKQNDVLMSGTDKILKNGNGNFFLICANNSSNPINLYFQNLSVTDQWGNPIHVVHKDQLIDKMKTKTRWKKFFSNICTGLRSLNAEKAGDITVKTNNYSNYHFNGSSYGSNGLSNMNGNISGNSTTNSTIRCEALRRQALQEVYLEGQLMKEMIDFDYKLYETVASNCYFDSNTLYPNTIYEAPFQIVVPKRIECQLEYLFFNLDIGNERHTFCFYCYPC